ncbi:MAG: hypothetical protein AAFX05_08550 [Planctomycetota bacterium]
MSNEGLFGAEPSLDEADALLISVYQRAGRTLDDLPYTTDFDGICTAVDMPHRTVLHRLMNLRKAGKLPRMGRAPSLAVRLEAEEEQHLLRMVVDAAGSVGQRDQLPYTSAFDAIVQGFNAETGRSLEAHDVWRLIAKLAK